MSDENSLEEIKKIWPKDAPDVANVPKYVQKYKSCFYKTGVWHNS